MLKFKRETSRTSAIIYQNTENMTDEEEDDETIEEF
jgi:hypothetical protein